MHEGSRLNLPRKPSLEFARPNIRGVREAVGKLVKVLALWLVVGAAAAAALLAGVLPTVLVLTAVVLVSVVVESVLLRRKRSLRFVLSVLRHRLADLSHLVAVAEAQHSRALTIVGGGGAPGGRFTLYLRSFDLEVQEFVGDRERYGVLLDGLGGGYGGYRAVSIKLQTFDNGSLWRLQSALAPVAPVVAVSNAAFLGHRMTTAEYDVGEYALLYLPRRSWEEHVRRLVGRADLVVIEAESATRGLVAELEMAVSCTPRAKVLVVLRSRQPGAKRTPDTDLFDLGRLAVPPDPDVVDRMRSLLAELPHVTYSEDMDWGPILEDWSYPATLLDDD